MKEKKETISSGERKVNLNSMTAQTRDFHWVTRSNIINVIQQNGREHVRRLRNWKKKEIPSVSPCPFLNISPRHEHECNSAMMMTSTWWWSHDEHENYTWRRELYLQGNLVGGFLNLGPQSIILLMRNTTYVKRGRIARRRWMMFVLLSCEK